MLEARDLRHAYHGRTVLAVEGVALQSGTRLALVGPNVFMGVHFNRYLMWAFPGLLCLMAVGLGEVTRLLARDDARLERSLFAAGSGLFLSLGLLSTLRFADYYGQMAGDIYRREVPTAEWIRRNLPPGVAIANVATSIEYLTGHRNVNFHGVTSPHFVGNRLVEKEACCGMPKLELGDFETVEKLKNVNIPTLARYAKDGFAILAAVPSCTLMFKQELPLLFAGDADVRAVADAMFDPFEYLVLRDKDGLLKTEFTQPLGKVSYHIPCHARVQNVGQKTREVLEWIPGTTVSTVERCAGHDGTWGVKKEYFDLSMKIGRPVFRQLAAAEPDWISSDCPIAARHAPLSGLPVRVNQARTPPWI